MNFGIYSDRMSGGTVMGSFAPYQAFAIGGPSSVRGYGKGAIGVGQSCLVSTTELLIPLVNIHYSASVTNNIIPFISISSNYCFADHLFYSICRARN